LRPSLLTHLIDRRQTALDHAAALLDSYSYEQVLKRGFVLVRDADGAPLGAAAQVESGQGLHLQFHDGVIEAVAGGERGPAQSRRSSRKTGGDMPPQGSLL
jgi:exodeoxyribonuclease VII large subunit